MSDTRRTVDAVWRIESARIVATLAKLTGDVGVAEDLAQAAVVDALSQWPESGVPQNPGAWLTAVAKRKAIDSWRRQERLDERCRAMAHQLEEAEDDEWQALDDDVLRLVFTACHPVLSREAQVPLTLRLVGGLTTDEIARMLLVPVATVQQRIVRAKRTLGAAHVPFATPEPNEWPERLGAALGVVYLMYTEGYAATRGDRWIRPELANEALRLGRVLAGLMPREPEVHGLVALMEFQASRFAARVAGDGSPILLAHQDRSRWDRTQIERGRSALRKADVVGRGRGSDGLQAAIAECHAIASSVEETDWARVVLLYEALGQLAPSPVVELNPRGRRVHGDRTGERPAHHRAARLRRRPARFVPAAQRAWRAARPTGAYRGSSLRAAHRRRSGRERTRKRRAAGQSRRSLTQAYRWATKLTVAASGPVSGRGNCSYVIRRYAGASPMA